MKRVLVYLAMSALLGTAGFGAWRQYATDRSRPPRFRAATARRGDLLATINATATVEPEEVVDVGAQIAGMIKEFGRDPRDSRRPIDYGSPVEKGTVLARIDDALYRTAVSRARAALGQAQTNVVQTEATLVSLRSKLAQTERDWHRARKLGPAKAMSDQDYDTARNAYESAEAAVPGGEAAVLQAQKTVETAQADLRQAEINLGYCTITSPVKGVIIDRRVNVGQTVVSALNAPSLFLIAKDLKRLQVWASVNEADIGRIRAGQAVRFSVDAFPGEKFAGVVAPDQPRLNATMTNNVVTYTVVVNTDNSSGRLLPYLTANAEFEVHRHPGALLVPNAALRWQPDPEQVAPDVREDYLRSLRQASAAAGEPSSFAREKEAHEHGQVWVPAQAFVRPAPIQLGLTDGMNTEVVGGDLEEGTPVVIGLVDADADTSTGTSNPFLPQPFKNKKP